MKFSKIDILNFFLCIKKCKYFFDFGELLSPEVSAHSEAEIFRGKGSLTSEMPIQTPLELC